MAIKRNYSYIVNAQGQRTSSNFGPRLDPITGAWAGHGGVDVAVSQNTPIRAAANGEVYARVEKPNGYGYMIIVAHPNSTNPTSFTLYGHLSELPTLVKGTAVVAGQQIGLSGNTGRSTGPHLHYEEREIPTGVVFSTGTDEERYASFFSAKPVNPAVDKFGFELAATAREMDALSPNTPFAQVMARLESRDQPNNGYGGWNKEGGGIGAVGRYGLRASALKAIGWMNEDGTFTEKAIVHGVTSAETLRDTPAAQEAARVLYMSVLKDELKNNGVWEATVGLRVNGDGTLVTEAGIIAAAWKEGARNVSLWSDEESGATQRTNIEFRLKQFELTNLAPGVFAPSALPPIPNGELAIDPIYQAALDSAFFGTVPGAPADAVFVPIRATGTPVQSPSNPTEDYVNSHIIPGRDGKTLLFPGGTSITLGAGEAYHLSSDLKTVTIARPAEGGVYIKTIYNTQLRSVGGSVVIGEGTPGRIVLKVNDPLAVNIDRVEGGIVIDAGNTIYTTNSSTGAAVLIVNSRDAQGNAVSTVKIRSNAQEPLTEVAGAQGAAVLSNGTVKIYTEQGVRTFEQGTLSAAEPVPTSNPQGADSLNEFINKDRTPEPTPTSPPNPSDATEELSGNLEPWLTELANQLDAGNVSLYASGGAQDSGRVFGFEDDFVYRGKDANGFIRLETLGGDGQSALPAGLAVYYDTETRQFILPAKDDTGPMLVNVNSGAAVALFNGQPKPQGWGFDTSTSNQLEYQSWDTISSGNLETVCTALAGSWVSFSVDEGADQLTGIASINGMSISATSNGIDPQDLAAWGFGFEGIDATDARVSSLLAALDPANTATPGWTSPSVVQTDTGNGILRRSLDLGNGITLSNDRQDNPNPNGADTVLGASMQWSGASSSGVSSYSATGQELHRQEQYRLELGSGLWQITTRDYDFNGFSTNDSLGNGGGNTPYAAQLRVKSEIYQADTSAHAAPGTLINIGKNTELVFTANTSGNTGGGSDGSGGSGGNTSDWTVSQVVQLAGQGFDNSASGQLSSNYQGAIADLNYANTQPEDVSAGLPAWISGSGLALARNAANTYNLITGFQHSPRRTLITTVINAVGSAYRNDRQLGESINTTTQALFAIDQIINGRTPLAQGLGVLNLVSTFDPQNTTLAGAGQIGGALSSLIGLQSALERGDALSAGIAAGSGIVQATNAYVNLVYGDDIVAADLDIREWLDFAESVGEALPYLNVINGLINGNPSAAVGAMVGSYVSEQIGFGTVFGFDPVSFFVGAIVTALFDAFFGDDPEPWGGAQYVWNEDGSVGIYAWGGDGGDQIARNFASQVQGSLQTIVDNANVGTSPENHVGLIANRMASYSYPDGAGFLGGGNGFAVYDTDAVTGSGIRLEPEFFGGIGAAVLKQAVAREAIAPLWEVNTVRQQTAAGDPDAGLTEVQRAGKAGKLAQALPAGATTQIFNPVVLDLNGDGAKTVSKAASQVSFNVDGSGFLKRTGWADNNDGFLVLDKNVNGYIDSGKDMFSNPLVQGGMRGLGSMAYLDANGDYRLTVADPVFSKLYVWQDANSNGQTDAGETRSMAQMGITSINYKLGTFERQVNGQTQTAQAITADLEADTFGSRYENIPQGILVITSNGEISLVATDVRSIEGPSNTAGNDVVGSVEDVLTNISVASLIKNDGVITSLATITAVGNARHGTVSLQGTTVKFTGAADYFGNDAGFTYTLDDGLGHVRDVNVQMDIAAVNDAPVIVEDMQNLKPLYGHKSFTIDTDTMLLTPTDPQYAPYYGLDWSGNAYDMSYPKQHDQIKAIVDPDGIWKGVVKASDVDDAALTYHVVQNSNDGIVSIDQSTGIWQYTPARDSSRDGFIVEVRDSHYNANTGEGATRKTIYFDGQVTTGTGGDGDRSDTGDLGVDGDDGDDGDNGSASDNGNGGTSDNGNSGTDSADSAGPIILDLDKNGIQLTAAQASQAFFDITGDGWRRRMGWASGGDGILAYDFNGDGKISERREIVFTDYNPNAQTDLQGLAAFDSNQDGVISRLDSRWAALGAWQDANGNGTSEAGEFQSLEALGITSISLTSDQQFSVQNGNTIHGTSLVMYLDGSTTRAADATLRVTSDALMLNADGSQTIATRINRQTGQLVQGTEGADLITGQVGNTAIIAKAGDDLVIDDDGNDVVDLGAGNDRALTGKGNDLVKAGDGNDLVFAGLGNDFVFGGAGNDMLFGEQGHDLIYGEAGNDVISLGNGNDLGVGGEGNDTITGEAGKDALFGDAGSDQLLGGADEDQLYGGAGDDLLDGGEGVDQLVGGANDDTYVVDNAGDTVTELSNEGTDTVRTTLNGFQLGANLEHLILTDASSAAASPVSGSGNELDNLITGNAANNTLTGLAGNDTLDGGTGADRLIGGLGDDLYIVDSAGDGVVELSGEGIDTVRADVSHALSANVERLELFGPLAINGTGNALANDMRGNAAANVLSGGLGNDSLAGGGGNDTYLFARGDGQDTITDAQGNNRLSLGAGINASDLRFSLEGANLIIGLMQNGQPTGDQITLANWFIANSAARAGAQRVSSIALADGSVIALNETALNHAPVAAVDTASLNEDTPVLSGNVLANDTDADEALTGRTLRLTNPGNYVGQYGTLSLLANGSYSYQLRSADADIQGLRQGQSLTESFAYQITDDAAIETGTAASTLSITIVGSNDGPIVQADAATLSEDGIVTATGNVLANDSDIDAGTVLSIANTGVYQGSYGSVVLEANGSYTYQLSNASGAVQQLNAGEQVQEAFTVWVTDGLAQSSSQLILKINGSYDALQVQADTAELMEDQLDAVSGNVLNNDASPNSGLNLSVSNAGSYTGLYGQLLLLSDGSYTYQLHNDALVQSLAQGQQVQDVFTVQTTDGVASASSALVLRITGSNDGPVVLADHAALSEDGIMSASGNVLTNDSDIDAGTALSIANAGVYQGSYGSLTLLANGNYSYLLNNASSAVQSLSAGQQVTDVFTLQTTDGIANVASSLTLTIEGSYDQLSIQADTAAVQEDDPETAWVRGNVLSNDSNPNASTYQSALGELSLLADGSYSYRLNNASTLVQQLAAGQQLEDLFVVSVTDGNTTVASNLTLSITGSNDGPIVLADTSHLAEDGAVSAVGNVLTNDSDIDMGDVLSVANVGTYQGSYGTLSLQANGSYSYALDNASSAVQSLRSDQQVADVFTVQTTDGIATVVSNLTVNITGSNDGPVAQGDVAAVSEDGIVTATGNVLTNDSDVDAGDVLTIANSGTYQGNYGQLTLQTNGSYSYALDNASTAVQSLRAGQQVADVFTLQTTDGIATAASNLTITVTGSNDGPVVQTDAAALSEDGIVTVNGNLLANDSDVDAGDVLSVANAGKYQGSYGSLVLQANGSYSYALNNASTAVQSLRADQQVMDVFAVSTTDGTATAASNLTINITGSNDIPVLAGTVSAQSATEIVAFNLGLPAGLFTDADAGDSLSYRAALANGNALPTWLSFNAATRSFSGTAAFEDITAFFGQAAGSLAIRVTATDSQGTQATANFSLTINQSPELNLIGTAAGDTLQGASRNDRLDGGSGADVMRGGLGDDRYAVDNTADLVTEFFNQGNDSIYASVNYVTPDHVENLFLAGGALTAGGNALANVLIGNVANNTLSGGAGQDLLAGWLGNDSLDGGQDGDTYLWNQGDGRDVITESAANSGVDRLRFGAGITLDSLVSREYTDANGQRRAFISVLDADGQERTDQGVELALSGTGSSATGVIERFELTAANGSISSFTLNQIKVSTVSTYGSNAADTLAGSRADDQIAGGNGNDSLYGRAGNDVLWGDNGQDRLFGEGGDDKLWGGNDDDWLQGGAGHDELGGDNGKDTLLGGQGDDKLYGGNDADILDAGSGNDVLIGDNGADQLFAGAGDDTLYGDKDADLLAAGAGNDLIDGDNGADLIIAGSGADSITSGNDGDFVDAGSGNDNIDTGHGADFIAGGKGDDVINAGQDSDVIAFNRGDGQDTLASGDWQQDTLSLGGIRYSEISLKKSGNHLILDMGQGDQITLSDWYASTTNQKKGLKTLQLITEGADYNAASSDRLFKNKVVSLDMLKLATAFDQARAAAGSNSPLNTGAASWAITSNANAALNTSYLSGSTTQAIGGDLAWRYATLNTGGNAALQGTGSEASYGNLSATGVSTAMNGMGGNGNWQNWSSNASAAQSGFVNPWIAMQAGISLMVEQPTGANPTLTPVAALTQDQLISQALGAQQQLTGVARPGWV